MLLFLATTFYCIILKIVIKNRNIIMTADYYLQNKEKREHAH